MEVVDRVRTERGELVLRRDGGRFEIISNGVFLMDTSDGTSERLLIGAALGRCRAAAPRMLIGGLGVGFSLIRAAEDGRVAAIDVVEIEPTIVRWHRRYLGAITAGALADPRVRVIEADVRDHLAASAGLSPAPTAPAGPAGDSGPDPARSAILVAFCSQPALITAKGDQDHDARDKSGGYDVICLDTDNGPNWLVFEGNAGIYDDRGLALAADALTPGGVLAVWSASRDPDFEARLHARFQDVEILETPRERGVPDIVYIATT